jgi:nicotinate phosphoribosyltransferase
VWRRHGADGSMAGDIVARDGDRQEGEPLLELVMRDGRRIKPAPTLDDIRRHAKEQLERLPEPLRAITPTASYPVKVAGELEALAADVDRRIKEKA